ncbi:MSMEG_0565 family glycosyltransferase [Lichenicoccus sp.]|uniref:MSMEG_0565 family glycosyltransferase n=1 Tax=Lichenicoccus sp. TaxID=2781899 RepID=UPI003D110AA3
MSGLRVGILAHSTNPRGGVVHALNLAEALTARGIEATLLAPATPGASLFRAPQCRTLLIPAAPVAQAGTETLVRTRRAEITNFLGTRHYDLLHAQDPISALALSDLEGAGHIRSFVRTVHHLDPFRNPVLARWQDMAVQRARGLFCVSRMWREIIAARYGRRSVVVGNGVETRRFTPRPDHRDAALRTRLLPGGERFVLAIGGIEERKNTLGTLRAFLRIMRAQTHPGLRLVIAGGASLLDHSAYRREFAAVLDRSGYADRVILAGVIEDADMPALYRSAALLCFASLQEGYGLCILEALACGIPVVAPHGAPFDEYLDPPDALRVDPRNDAEIASAILRALQPPCAQRAYRHGPVRAARFAWDEVATAHLAGYYHHRELADA